MNTEQIHREKHTLLNFKYEKEGDAWYLNFDNELSIRLECFWRLISKKGIEWTSNDHLKRFGLEKPIDLEFHIYEILSNRSLLQIHRKKLTGDLFLIFDHDYVLEALTDSSGFENWEINLQGKVYIGLGKGGISKYQ